MEAALAAEVLRLRDVIRRARAAASGVSRNATHIAVVYQILDEGQQEG